VPTEPDPAEATVPVAPVGRPRLNTCDGARPVIVAVADPPVATVVTVPIDRDDARE
jgi:hypothetical protein